jgi:hypothetical protein
MWHNEQNVSTSRLIVGGTSIEPDAFLDHKSNGHEHTARSTNQDASFSQTQRYPLPSDE